MSEKPLTFSRILLAVCLATSFLLFSACALENARRSALLATLSELERTPSLSPAALGDIDILALDPEAREFVDHRLAGLYRPYDKVRALRNAVFAPDGLGFSLDNKLTLTADETFDKAGGNCVALANFFVAAARHAGINARYQELEREIRPEEEKIAGEEGESAGQESELRVVERHINVSGTIIWRNSRQARYVLDYLAVPEQDFGKSRLISDRRAFTHYYNNHAIRHLQEGEVETALQYLKKAIMEDVDVDFVWSNLGVVYTRRGDFEAAEFAYRRALDLDRNNLSASRNLDSLHARLEGDRKTLPD